MPWPRQVYLGTAMSPSGALVGNGKARTLRFQASHVLPAFWKSVGKKRLLASRRLPEKQMVFLRLHANTGIQSMWNSENIWKRYKALSEEGIDGRTYTVSADSNEEHPLIAKKLPVGGAVSHRPAVGLRFGGLLICALLLGAGGPAAVHAQDMPPSTAIGTDTSGDSGKSSTQEQSEALPPELAAGPVEVKELWTGSLYSSTYRVGVCFSADGSVRGVVHLRLYNGKVDVYHIVGSVRNNEIEARHSSGHTFKGRLVSANRVEGVIKLKSGMKVQLEGTRTHDVPLAPENCAPLPQ